MLLRGSRDPGRVMAESNFIVAQLYAHVGDYAAALRAVRRRHHHMHAFHVASWFLGLMREEGKLAALAGDTAGAIKAYRHYLTLRTDPGPGLRAEVDAVRAALEELLR